MEPVYLDHNATTPMRGSAIAAVAAASAQCGKAQWYESAPSVMLRRLTASN